MPVWRCSSKCAPLEGWEGAANTAARCDRGVSDAADAADAAPCVSYRRVAPPPRVQTASRRERDADGKTTEKTTEKPRKPPRRAGSPGVRSLEDQGGGAREWEGARRGMLACRGVVGAMSSELVGVGGGRAAKQKRCVACVIVVAV